VLIGPMGPFMNRLGVIHADPENAEAALASGAVVLVFPGGITTPTGPRGSRTPSTSTVAPGMRGRPSKRGCRSFPRSPSAPKRLSSF
jgi:hypothetical protein